MTFLQKVTTLREPISWRLATPIFRLSLNVHSHGFYFPKRSGSVSCACQNISFETKLKVTLKTTNSILYLAGESEGNSNNEQEEGHHKVGQCHSIPWRMIDRGPKPASIVHQYHHLQNKERHPFEISIRFTIILFLAPQSLSLWAVKIAGWMPATGSQRVQFPWGLMWTWCTQEKNWYPENKSMQLYKSGFMSSEKCRNSS